MKTIFIILLTLLTSQFLYIEYGPRNPVAQVSSAVAGSLRWFLNSALQIIQ